MYKKIIDNLRWLIKGEKNSEKRETLRETLKTVKSEKKDEIQRQKENKKQMRRFMKTRNYWNKEANIRAERFSNSPVLIHHKNFKEYKLENKSNAKTIEIFLQRIKSRILSILEINNKSVFTLTVHLSKMNALKNFEIQEYHFVRSGIHLMQKDEFEKIYDGLFIFFNTKISEEMLKGSGWQLKSIDSLQVKLIPFSPLKGGFSVDLPENLKNLKSILHFRNNDEFCLKWALTHGIFPKNNKIDKTLKMKSNHLIWEKMIFPSDGNDLKYFESANAPVRIFCYGKQKNGEFFTYYFSKDADINLLFYENHFFPIKDEKLFHKYLFKSKNCFVCKSCMNNFKTPELLSDHKIYCQEEYQVKTKMPKPGKIFFRKHSATLFHPVSFYMDIEAILKPIDESAGNKTRKYQKHEFLYLGLYEVNKITHENKYHFFDDPSKFYDFLNQYSLDFSESIDYHKKRIPKIPENYSNDGTCDYCKKEFEIENKAVIHHCHYSGKFLGLLHNNCNLQLKQDYFIPVFCHNLMKYDEKFIIRLFTWLKIIAKNMENFISFKTLETDISFHFIDSYKFLQSSLEKLVENLKGNTPLTNKEIGNISGKGVMPYDYITSKEVLKETQLPAKEFFYSKLHKKECSEEDYQYALKMWNFYKCETLDDYLKGYLKSDCIFLADCVENFRKLTHSMFSLDPAHYVSLPSLSFDCFLKNENIFLEKITDPTIYNFLERGIKGGESFIAKRYAKANNRYMKNYDASKPSSFLILIDANSLYPTNMCKDLPYKNFHFNSEEDFNWEKEHCILDVDISVPEDKHEFLSDYPLFPEHINGKLIGNLNPKKHFIVHSEYLKVGLKLGYKIDKIHKILRFDSSKIMKHFIMQNAEKRKQATTDFEKTFWKDLSNILYGKSIEDVKKRINIEMDFKNTRKLERKPYFMNIMEIGDRTLYEMKKMSVTLDKPIYIGKTILDYSKAFMANFWYFHLKAKYGKNINLLMTDTDSFFFEVFTEDFYEDILHDDNFDTSNFPDDFKTLSGNKMPKRNKKVLGKFKDENGGKICTHFIGLRPKQYSYKTDKTVKKAKGVTKDSMRDITFEDYENVLFGERSAMNGKMNVIRSKNHELFTEEIEKKFLDKHDEKRQILDDGIHTVPWGFQSK